MNRAAASLVQSWRWIAATAFQSTYLTQFVESSRTLKRGLLDPYRPELHYMVGPGPKWRERHVAQNVEERASHPTSARALLRSVAVTNSVLVALILFSGIALTVISARALLASKVLSPAGFSTISCFMHAEYPVCSSDARSARSAYSRRWRPGDPHSRTSEPSVSPRPRCQEDLGYGRTSSWGCG
jgi:hypothetical protein